MCGISGLWNLQAQDVSSDVFLPFIDSLAHRGPDGRGVHHDAAVRLWLGHRRLAILDLTNAAVQPMSYLGRYWLTFNGEIYNFLELKKELEMRGYYFSTLSDSEVILAAYDCWGSACQLKFNGMWAFAIWDQKQQELFISRDRFGVKPLFYFYDASRFAFASEMKAFLSLSFIPFEFDFPIIARALADSNSIESGEECLLKGMKRLKPGHSLTLSSRGEMKICRWWNTLDHLEVLSGSFDERIKEFFSLFKSACQLRMRSDVPFGSAVSGGLDSSSILSLLGEIRRERLGMDRIRPEWHKAFIATYPGTSQNERNFAEEIIRYTQAPAIYYAMDPTCFTEFIEQVLFSMEEVFDAPLGPWLLYREYRKQGIVISIDGHGADELLGGYHHHVDAAASAALFNPFRFRDLRRIQKDLYPPGSPYSPRSPSFLAKESLRRALQRYPQSYRLLKKFFSKNRLKEWIKIPWTFPMYSKQTPFDVLGALLYEDFHERTLPTILRNFDRCSMAHGIEVRSPFMDYRLVAFAFSLRANEKIGKGQTKRILREAMIGRLPEVIRARKNKVGFASPMIEWMRGSLKPFILDSVNNASFLNSVIWDGPLIRDYVQKSYERGEGEGIRSCWEFIAANTLMELFKKKRRTYDFTTY